MLLIQKKKKVMINHNFVFHWFLVQSETDAMTILKNVKMILSDVSALFFICALKKEQLVTVLIKH